MYSLLLLNGGVGKRVTSDRPKQFIRVNAIPTIVYSLVAADRVPSITEIVVNFPAGWQDEAERVIREYAVQTPVRFVEAGATRQESVAKLVDVAANAHVIIHESARPLVTSEDFQRLIDEPYANVAYALPIPFTVAPVDPQTRTVTGYLDRDSLRNVQLPQKFDRGVLLGAHERAVASGASFTEDATLVVLDGTPVHFIDGADRNIKVTTKTDVKLAGFLLAGGDDDDV